MDKYSQLLLRFSAIFALIGAFLGSHIAGAGSYEFKSVHAHLLVVGWLTLFAWAVYYKVFKPKKSLFSVAHVYTAIIGSLGLTIGMWLYFVRPFALPEILMLMTFIIGGSVLLLSFLLFLILTFMKTEK